MTLKPQIDSNNNYIPYPQNLKLLVRATDSSTGFKELSGYGKTITVLGTNVVGSSTYGGINPYSITMSGSGGLSLPNSSDYKFGTGNFTISFWIYRISSQSYLARIIEFDISSGFSVYYNASNYICIGLAGVYPAMASLAAIPTNVWTHIAFIRDSATSTKMYINGVVQATYTANWTTGTVTSALTIGTYDGSNYCANGYIDEIAIWNGVAVPISSLYPQMKPFSFRRA